MMKHFFLFILLITLSFQKGYSVEKVAEIAKGDLVIQGFGRKVSGNDISFHSHLPGVTNAMIVRTLNHNQTMEWETEVLPSSFQNKFIDIAWIAGVSGLMHGKTIAPLSLYVNGKKVITLQTGGGSHWTVKGTDQTSLSFRGMLKDGSEDRFGYMYLRIPKKLAPAGKSIKLKLVASNSNTDSWVMVFQSAIESGKLSSVCQPAIRREDSKQIVRVSYNHFGAPQQAKIELNAKSYQRNIVFGENHLEIALEPVKKALTSPVRLVLDGKTIESTVDLIPVRKWETNFMQITHTDIGYTRPQTDILAEHVRFLDYVLDYCDQTDNYPEESKFRWTCEGTWAVSEFLQSRPKSQIDRFIKRVKEGRIELTAMYFNFDELPDEQTLAASLKPLADFKKLGLEGTQVATQNDVNGIGWCFNEYFPEIGVKYLTMGVNLHKAVAPFDMPTYFWWTSPSGKRILAYYGEHYMHGNALGVNGTDFEQFETKLLNYLSDLDKKGFAYDIVGCEFLGIGGDNSAPSITASAIVKKWNEKYEWPKIRLSLFKDYLSKIEEKYGKDIPAIRGAWPDWWTDGFGSGAFESAASRTTQSEMVATQNGLSLAKIMGSEFPVSVYNRINEVNDCLLFYGEHTYGFDASIWQPFCRETMEQRFLKSSYTWEGFRRGRMLGESALGFLNEYVSKAEKPSVVVFNPLSWERTGIARTYIDFSILPLDKEFTITDAAGNKIKAQMVTRKHDGAYWNLWVEKIPSLGYKQYFIQVENKPRTPLTSVAANINSISNPWYELKIDEKRGTITSLYDKELGKDIIEEGAKWQFGELIHEKLDSRFLDERVMKGHTRNAPTKMRFTGFQQGEIWNTYSFRAHSDAGIGDGENMGISFKIYNCTKRIDISLSLTKKLDTNPEAIYISFPFTLEEGKLFFDVPGGVIEAGVDQIQGTSNDWNNVQTFAAVRNKKAQIILGSPETPMMQLGDINTGRFQKNAVPKSNQLFSYVMNNYWTTNFNADQHGEFQWNYFMTSMPSQSLEKATKFAWENRVPYISRALPAGTGKANAKTEGSFLSVQPQNVVVVTMKPIADENAILVQLREVDGREGVIDMKTDKLKQYKVIPSNVLGENRSGELSIRPYETKFVKLIW